MNVPCYKTVDYYKKMKIRNIQAQVLRQCFVIVTLTKNYVKINFFFNIFVKISDNNSSHDINKNNTINNDYNNDKNFLQQCYIYITLPKL